MNTSINSFPSTSRTLHFFFVTPLYLIIKIIIMIILKWLIRPHSYRSFLFYFFFFRLQTTPFSLTHSKIMRFLYEGFQSSSLLALSIDLVRLRVSTFRRKIFFLIHYTHPSEKFYLIYNMKCVIMFICMYMCCMRVCGCVCSFMHLLFFLSSFLHLFISLYFFFSASK